MKDLEKFMMCVKNIKPLREKFISCKDLKESYDTFKIMLNGCSYEEYEKFFKDLINSNNLISDEELESIAGGAFNFKSVVAPLMALMVFSGTPVKVAYADNSTSVSMASTQDTAQKEIEFSLKYIESLPKKGEKDFDKFLEITNVLNEDLLENREDRVKHRNGTTETIKTNEKEVYQEIEKTVQEIKQKVKNRTPEENMSEEDIKIKINNKEISKHYELPEKMRIAKAIYRWVAKNIPYDEESIEKSAEGESLRKPQDALFVFSQKRGTCAGKANLLNLMMKMAKIPSAVVGTTVGKSGSSHAYNAIYLEDTTNNREGWTLIDSTWASPKSDSTLQMTEKEIIDNLIEGSYAKDPDIGKNRFNTDDDYTRKIGEIIYINMPWEKETNMSDDDIAELNRKTDDKLKELNKNRTNGLKFEKLEFFKTEYGVLNVKYKTNLTRIEAAEINKEIETKRKVSEEAYKYKMKLSGMLLDEDTLYSSGNSETSNYENIFSNEIYDKLNEVNSKKDSSKSKRSEEYNKRVKEICKSFSQDFVQKIINGEYNNIDDSEGNEEIQENIDKINEEIQNEINKINSEYQDIVTFKRFEITFNYDIPSLTSVNADTSLSYDEAKSLFGEEGPSLDKMHIYFPGFYNSEYNFKEANKFILNEPVHKIEEIENKTVEDFKNIIGYDFKIDGVKYKLIGKEGNSSIRLEGDLYNPLENVKIPSDIAKFGIKFEIDSGIKSLILEGDETIAISSYAYQLESIDATKSTRYVTDEQGNLYEKNSDGSRGSLLYTLKGPQMSDVGEIDNLHYMIERDDSENKIIGVKVFIFDNSIGNVRLPKSLVSLNVPIKISIGIKSLILEGDEIIDLSESYNLESIDATKSIRYVTDEQGNLYEKNADGSKGKTIWSKN